MLSLARAADDLIATCIIELPPGDPPEWVQLMPAGELSARDGRRWRLADAAGVVEASRARAGATDLVFDYGHQTEYSRDNGQPAPAAGWIKELQARADGIWGRVEWTERARAMLKAREYRYVSPTFQHTKAGVVTEVLRAALTNNPALDLPALAHSGGSMHEQLKRILAKLGLAADSEPTAAEADAALARIDPDPPIDLAELAKALGLQATAAAAEVLAAAKARGVELAKALGLAETATAAEVLAAAKTKASTAADADPTAFVPRAEFDRVSVQLTELQTARADDEATKAVDAAIKAGKLAPAQRDWGLAAAKKDLAGFKSYADSAPVIVTPAAAPRTPAAGGDPEAALTSEEQAVCKSLGLTEEAFKKSRAADIAAQQEVA